MSFDWTSSFATDRGKHRAVNEDAYVDHPAAGIWLVADGLGGHTMGDVASGCIARSLSTIRPTDDISVLVQEVRRHLLQAQQLIRDACAQAAGKAVFSADLPQAQMASTVVVFLACGDEWRCLWAGDSRAYTYQSGEFAQLTRDHSVVQELIDKGELPADTGDEHPFSNQITRAIGAIDPPHLDEVGGRLKDGLKVLLCSDGLYREVSAAGIHQTLAQQDSAGATSKLLGDALSGAARDNITLGVVEFEEVTLVGRR